MYTEFDSETKRLVKSRNVSIITIQLTFLQKCNVNQWKLLKKYENVYFVLYQRDGVLCFEHAIKVSY